MKRILIAITIILALMLSMASIYAAAKKPTGTGCPMMQSGKAGNASACPMMKSKQTTGKSASCPMMKGQSGSQDMSKCDMQKTGSCPMRATAATKGVKSAVCPVMGRKITKAAGKSVYKGKTYYFCCPSCKRKFDANPAKYVKPALKATVVSAVCPVMGTKIPDVTKAAGKSVYKGKTYYFCCGGCKPRFDANPVKYINK